MSVINEITVDFHISKFQMFVLKMINCPRVFFGLGVWVPRFCATPRIIIPIGSLDDIAKVVPPPRNP